MGMCFENYAVLSKLKGLGMCLLRDHFFCYDQPKIERQKYSKNTGRLYVIVNRVAKAKKTGYPGNLLRFEMLCLLSNFNIFIHLFNCYFMNAL